MKIKDILHESATDLVARFHSTKPTKSIDRQYNPESREISDKNLQYYRKYFEENTTPVFTKETNFHDPDATPWTNKPSEDERQSPGYRGQQYVRSRAGMPTAKDVQTPPGNAIPVQIGD